MVHQPSSTRRREGCWRADSRPARRSACRALLAALLFGLIPVEALAQRSGFIEAFVAFHSRLIGTYGDEGPQIAASLEEMAARLAAWEREAAAAEARLRSGGAGAPGDVALLYLDSGRREDALRALDAAIGLEPDRAALHRLRALVLESIDRPMESLAALTTAWELDPDDPIGAYLLADRRTASDTTADVAPQVAALLDAYDRTQAAGVDRPSAPFVELSLVDDLAADTPIFSPVLYADGLDLIARGQFRAAIARFREAVTRDPLVSDPALRSPPMAEGIATLRSGRPADAIPPLNDAVAAAPGSSEVHRILGAAYRAAGDDGRAVEHLRTAVRLAPQDERAQVGLGRTLMDAGRLEEAETALRDTLARLPASGEARWALADLYERRGRGLDAVAQLDAAASLTVLAGKVHLHWRIAQLLHQHQDYDGVAAVLGRRARLVPNEPAVHKDAGLAYARLGRPSRALVELLLSAVIGIEDAETLAAIGQIHLDAREYARAERALRRAVAMEPDLPQARYALGTTLVRSGRLDEGRKHLGEFQRLRAEALERQQRTLQGGVLNDGAAVPPEPAR